MIINLTGKKVLNRPWPKGTKVRWDTLSAVVVKDKGEMITVERINGSPHKVEEEWFYEIDKRTIKLVED